MTGPEDMRARAEELLLLRLNGRLDAEEARELDALLTEHPEFAEAEPFLKALKGEIAAREVGASPGEFGLARLKRAVAEEAKQPVEPSQAAESNVVSMASRSARTWRYAAIAATVLFAIQTASVFMNPEAVLKLAGGSIERHQGPVFVVAFVPEATEAEIRALLTGLDLTIVDGPSALGLYQIAAAEDAVAQTVLGALKAAPAVESAEMK